MVFSKTEWKDDTYISGWYCNEWMSLVEYDDTCDKWKEENDNE